MGYPCRALAFGLLLRCALRAPPRGAEAKSPCSPSIIEAKKPDVPTGPIGVLMGFLQTNGSCRFKGRLRREFRFDRSDMLTRMVAHTDQRDIASPVPCLRLPQLSSVHHVSTKRRLTKLASLGSCWEGVLSCRREVAEAFGCK